MLTVLGGLVTPRYLWPLPDDEALLASIATNYPLLPRSAMRRGPRGPQHDAERHRSPPQCSVGYHRPRKRTIQ
jgi:hypothetical protein